MASGNQQRVCVRQAGSDEPWQILRRTDGAPGITTNMEDPNEVDSSGQQNSMMLTSITVGGDTSIAFSASTYDLIIRNVMGSEWQSDGSIVIGQDTPALEFLVAYMDVGSNGVGYLISEANVSQLQLSISAGSALTGSFSVVGEGYNANYDFSGDSFTDETSTKVINCAQDINEIVIDGQSQINVCVNSMDLTINRNYQEDACVGHLVAHQDKGTAQGSGSISLALTQDTFNLLEQSINEEEFGIRVDMGDGNGNQYLFELLRVKLGVEMPSGGRDAILRPSVNYNALRDATADTFIRITRTQADTSGSGDGSSSS
ncbi:hypothetical protein C7446_2570 [Kushneria sinocarnis]|uniref:Uncharacterized protein n=1 Tax=Kushneria sinocarnis TaxID=595502 RepID=A0A420WUP4_9GAMM|nr:phage tail tube protein [Kushneria sinocarnis]RKQ97150.1 hypothetical protein C7446_2570 [Kushneria sinocarnis]